MYFPIYLMDYSLITRNTQAKHFWYRLHKTTHHQCLLFLTMPVDCTEDLLDVSYDAAAYWDDAYSALQDLLKEHKDSFLSTAIVGAPYVAAYPFLKNFELLLEVK